jgi:hypothetical protein
MADDETITDDDLVTAIIDELRDDQGSLKDPRHPEARTSPIAAHARAEVHRSLALGRMLEENAMGLPSAADVRAYLKAKRKLLITHEARAAHDRLRVEPPPKVDASKWWCASEAFELMELYSNRLPSNTGRSDTKCGAFQTIASLLYTGVYNKRDENLQRACAGVLRERRAVLRGVSRLA